MTALGKDPKSPCMTLPHALAVLGSNSLCLQTATEGETSMAPHIISRSADANRSPDRWLLYFVVGCLVSWLAALGVAAYLGSRESEMERIFREVPQFDPPAIKK